MTHQINFPFPMKTKDNIFCTIDGALQYKVKDNDE